MLASAPCKHVKFLTGKELGRLEPFDGQWRDARPDLPLSFFRMLVFGAVQDELIAAQQFGRDVPTILGRIRPDTALYDATLATIEADRALLERLRLAAAFMHATAHELDLPETHAAAARQAFRSFERKGFKEAAACPGGPEAKGFSAAIAPLTELWELVRSARDALPDDDFAIIARQDAEFFQKRFTAMYANEGNRRDAV